MDNFGRPLPKPSATSAPFWEAAVRKKLKLQYCKQCRKFQHYRQLASLQEYVRIAQDGPRIERFVRQENDAWVLTDASGLAASLELTSIVGTLALVDVYEKVTFETENDTET